MANIYKNTALNSSELTQIVTLPCNIEYKAKEITGGNYIKLVNADFANVSIYFNTKKDRSTAKILNNSNRGLIWKEANPITGEAYLYNNFYIWTEGTSTTDLVLEVSSNGEILTPLLGNTAVSEAYIQGVTTQAQINVNDALKNTFNKIPYVGESGENDFLYNKTISGECGKFYNAITTPTADPAVFANSTQGKIFMLIDETDNFFLEDGAFYRVTIDGYIDLGTYIVNSFEDIYSGVSTQRLRLGLYTDEIVSLDNPLADIRCINSEQLYKLDNDVSVSKNNFFDFWGTKSLNQNSATSHPSYFNKNINTGSTELEISYDKIVSGNFIKQFQYLGFYLNCYLSLGSFTQDDSGFHYSLNIQISRALTRNDIGTSFFL